ncbi:hypothetical protein MFLAVUS_006376 [Mucor flavus]|uniref:Uncharacterized protein n=1 Tax=Mucor flavus TaxID=439312 RepID=A0ABP9Z1D7_9FUNG
MSLLTVLRSQLNILTRLLAQDGNGDVRIAKCTTGGTLIIRGTKDYYHGECIDATGGKHMEKYSIDFYFASGNPPTKFTRCKAGGALFIHGTQENYHGECIDTDRVSTVVSFEDGEDPFFLKCF